MASMENINTAYREKDAVGCKYSRLNGNQGNRSVFIFIVYIQAEISWMMQLNADRQATQLYSTVYSNSRQGY